MEREKTDDDGSPRPERETTRPGSDMPPASGPSAPSSAETEGDRDGKADDNRKGGYGAG